MFQRKQRRFRRRSNGRDHSSRENGYLQVRPGHNLFSNSHTKNNFRQTQSAEKLFEKYSTLAKEAMSTGDKTLGENYLQHADHFMRIIEDKNRNREQNKIGTIDKEKPDNKIPTENDNIKKDDTIKNKE